MPHNKPKTKPEPRRVRAKDPHWKLIERVAAFVEKSFDGAADVRHNQRLPSRKLPGKKRQCDVTVRTGPAHRRTLTIVEVQKRKTKVDVNTFDGWCEKMRELGAQHLVCVSAKGFPKSVIARAALMGPTVRLATLQEIEENRWPATGMRELVIITREVLLISRIHVLTKNRDLLGPGGDLDFEAAVFETPIGKRVTLNELARESLEALGTLEKPKPGVRSTTVETSALTFIEMPQANPVRLRFMLSYAVRQQRPPIEFLEYTQTDDEQARTWVMSARVPGSVPDQEYVFRTTFRPDADGRLRPHMATIEGLPPGSRFAANIEAIIQDQAPTTGSAPTTLSDA